MVARDDNDRAMGGERVSAEDDLGPVRLPAGDPPVLVQGSTWWVREADGYYQIEPALVVEALERCRPDVDTWADTDTDKPRRLTRREIYSRHGRRVDEVVYELGGATRYEARGADGGTLYLGRCHPEPAEPVYHARIAEWLHCLGGGDPWGDAPADAAVGPTSVRLLDWLATCHQLDRPTAALYLRGERACGKSMLALAICRGFGPHSASYSDVVLGNYSGALLRSPILTVSERVPEMPGKPAAALFREAVTATSRALTEKYQASGTLRGCPRIVISANDDDALRLGDSEDRAGDDAIGERILRCVAHPGTGDLLRSWGGWQETQDWVESGGRPGRIWEHVAWLREHHVLSRAPERLLVYGDPATWLAGVAARHGLARGILLATARAVASSDHSANACASVDAGVVHVYVAELQGRWAYLAGDQRAPSLQQLGRALGKIADRRRGSDRRWSYPVPIGLVDAVVLDTGCVPWSEWQAMTGRRASSELG